MRTLRPIRAAAALALALGVLTAGTAGHALASCVAPPDPATAVKTADIVFVGKVTHVSSMGRTAEVAVLEVWRGPDQPASVTINDGEADNAFSSVDRTFVEGTTYLFFPYADPVSGKLADNSCSNTMAFDASLGALRPSDARLPIGATPPPPTAFEISSLLPVGVAFLVFGALFVVGLLARGRQEA